MGKNNLQHYKFISVEQNVRFGKPVITGTRITVQDILMLLKNGVSIDEIPHHYPHINVEQAKEAIDLASKKLSTSEEIFMIQSS